MSTPSHPFDFATRAIHAGQTPDPSTGAIMTPIYATSTYVQQSPGVHQGFEYSRSQNPTRHAYERCLADLESGSRGFAFASGMAAIATVLELVDSGSHILAMNDLYGGSFRLFDQVRQRSAGLTFSFADLSDPSAAASLIRPETRMIWVESPTNPMLTLVDLAAVGRVAKANDLLFVVDNTFASPYLQRPTRIRCRYRGALRHQIPQWSLRCCRRRSGGQRQWVERTAVVSAKRRGSHRGTF